MENAASAVRAEEKADSAHRRIDEINIEVRGLRDAKHDLYSRIHTHAGILTGIEGAVQKLTQSTEAWAKKTDTNTQTQIQNRAIVITAMTVGGFITSGFLGFIIFVGGKILHWW